MVDHMKSVMRTLPDLRNALLLLAFYVVALYLAGGQTA